MADILLNILSLGIKPLYEKQNRFHCTILEFRNRLSKLEEANLKLEDIGEFYKTINGLRFSLFRNYYKRYIKNLNRFKPVEENNFDVTFLKIAIAEDEWKPTKPLAIFKYHIKYKYKLTSGFFIFLQKKQNYKKLNPSVIEDKKPTKFNTSKKWTRVPLTKDACKPDCGCSK